MATPPMAIPSVDELLRSPRLADALTRYGRAATLGCTRIALQQYRDAIIASGSPALERPAAVATVAQAIIERLAADHTPRLRRVFNLTGTVLHTNLGRALLPEPAIEAAIEAMRQPAALEFDIDTGGRGERDNAIRPLLKELTGAEDAIAVNNNAAAVMLVLATLGAGKETIVSRGELIEIGGAFRMPDIMARAGTRLVEVGTTNRTHPRDYEAAIGPDTGLLMKVHTSNYLIQGFTAEVDASKLASLARAHAIPFVDDLGSGTLVDLSRWGLARERTVADAIRDGADLVTFSGDKLLGGAQAGFIVGRRDLVQLCARNPMKRAMRLDKVRLAALEATLRLYRDPDTLHEKLPTLRLLARRPEQMQDLASRLCSAIRAALGEGFDVDVRSCASQIGSGALPLETLPSLAVAIAPTGGKTTGDPLGKLADAFRRLPIPVIGRIEKAALLLDLRCLEDEPAFVANLSGLAQLLPAQGATKADRRAT